MVYGVDHDAVEGEVTGTETVEFPLDQDAWLDSGLHRALCETQAESASQPRR